MTAPRPKTLLIIEDDVGLRTTLAAAAAASGYDARACASAEDGLRVALSFKPTLIFCDVHLAGGDGRAVLARLRADAGMGDCQFVIMTGDWVGASQQASIENSADAYLAKPFTIGEFVDCAEERFRQANL